ncbi:hypothetical protein RJG79_07990 [Mycoplasmatota bacterium WC44]
MKKRIFLLKGFLLSEKCLKTFLLIYFIVLTVVGIVSFIMIRNNYNFQFHNSRGLLNNIVILITIFGQPLGVWFENVAIIIVLILLIELRNKKEETK